MGLNISDIVPRRERDLSDFSGRKLAIDGFNALYQFLSTIRQPDGTPLKDAEGRTTSHLAGTLYRTVNLLEAGIKPVFVMDGVPHELKRATIEDRRFKREKAYEEWKMALEEGDLEKAKSKAQQTSRLTPDMVEEVETLLDLMGVPHVSAPQEGEAQASFMAARGDVWGAASQDFDALLFGSPNLVRNLTSTGRRKLPRKNIYVTVAPEEVTLDSLLAELDITREQLVDIGILVGTDFNDGIKGIGQKKALKLVKKHGGLEAVLAEKGEEIEHYREIRDIFLDPDITEDYDLEWRRPDGEGIESLLCGEHGFSENRVKNAVKKATDAAMASAQSSLDRWF